MPLDGTINTPALNRARLIEALRNDTQWNWDFCNSASCAIGMARIMWPGANLRDYLGVSGNEYEDIFGLINETRNINNGKPSEWCDYYGCERTQVTPQMVADALERLA